MIGDEYQFGWFLRNLFSNQATKIFQNSIGYVYLNVVKNINYNDSKHRLHLLGDPTMSVWTATPQNLSVAVSPSTIVSGPNQIMVKVNNLPSGQQALICLMKEGEGYATLTISDTKPHTFTFTPRTAGTLNVTVTAHNFRPYELTMPVQVNNNTAVYIADLAFDDGAANGTIGDVNGQLDAGETVGLTIKLKNSGKVDYNQAMGTLRCSSPYIKIIDKYSNFGAIPSNGTWIASQSMFRFQIDKNAPEIHRNDLDAIQFFLDIRNNSANMFTDTFKIDVFAPELELREQSVSFSDNRMGMQISLINIGKARAIGLKGTLSSESPNVVSFSRATANYPILNKYITRPNAGYFVCNLKSASAKDSILNMKLTVTNEYGKTWTFHFDPNEKGEGVFDFAYTSYPDGIELSWYHIEDFKYNIYRSTSPDGNYTRINRYPLTISYYRDETVLPLTNYYYKVAAISQSMNPGELTPYIKASCCCPLLEGFPCIPNYGSVTNGAINVEDINYDGKKEIFSTNWFTNNKKGYLIGIKANGQNLFGGDQLNSIGELSASATGIPAIGDLYGKGEQNVVTTTWKDSPADQNSVACFSPQDINEDKKADLLWQTATNAPFYRGVVLANLDQSSDGTMEIVAKSNAGVPIRILDSKGNIKRSVGTGDYSMPAIADLDEDGDMEIIACDESGINIWHHDGTPFKGTNPFWSGSSLLSSPVICDLNKDGYKEIIAAEKKVNRSHVYVIDLNGNKMPEWYWNTYISYTSDIGSGLDHGLSVGDLDGDGNLEVVILGCGRINVWSMAGGSPLLGKRIEGLFPSEPYNVNIRVPILADVDGDSKADIIYSIGDAIYALRHDGTFIEGFPLKTNNVIQGTLVVSDIDNDGKNEIVAADNDSYFYAWKTNGDSNAIEWGSERHDSRNTGEYGTFCQPTLIRSNTTWNGETPCGNVIVQSGTLTIPTGKSITLEKTSKIVVRPGATLLVDGGSILNGYIWALPGSTVTIKNNGTIKLRLSGNLIIESGAVFNQEYGSVVL